MFDIVSNSYGYTYIDISIVRVFASIIKIMSMLLLFVNTLMSSVDLIR